MAETASAMVPHRLKRGSRRWGTVVAEGGGAEGSLVERQIAGQDEPLPVS